MNLLALGFALLTLVGLIYQLAALAALHSFLRRPLPRWGPGDWPAISVLKPVRGLDADTRACLASFIHQEYPSYQILFGVAQAADPVMPLLVELQEKNRHIDIQIIVCSQKLGMNPKVSTLRQLLPRADHELLVISDSDVQAAPDLLQHLAAALEEHRAGLATCLYRSGPVGTVGGALEALSISADFIPSVALAHYLEGIHFALGAVMAVPRRVLEEIGGLEALADYLADDYQLGFRVSQAGYEVQLLPHVVATMAGRTTVAGYLARHLRWARTYRVCRPRGYFAYGVTFALPWGLLSWLASGLAAPAAQLFFLCLLVRYTVALLAGRSLQGRLPWAYFLLLPLKDLLSFGLWLLSFAGDTVVWQGRRYGVTTDGRLQTLAGGD